MDRDSLAARASQSVPPATRRRVLRRDKHRCVVPGCSHSIWVDVHHVTPRSEGGDHDPDRLITLCGAHHAATHRGRLTVEGTVVTGLRFRHADGSPYGQLGSTRAVDVDTQTKAFAALRGMGFREGEVKRALDALRTRADLDATDIEAVLRAALLWLAPSPGARTSSGPVLRSAAAPSTPSRCSDTRS